MTTLRPYRQMRQQVAFTIIVALAFSQVRSSAALVYLNGRGDGLNSPLSYQKWTPLSSGDTLVWSGPLPGGGATVNGLVSGSGSLNLNGIVVTNAANGALTLQPSNPSGASLQTINLGAGGLDLAEANQNLTINKTNGSGTLALSLTAAQVWDVGPGRTLTVNADTTSTHQLTLSTLGASTAITVGGALNMPTAALVIDKQGTGNIALNGAVIAQSINAVNEVAGNLSFGSTVVAPTINIVNKNTGSLSFSNTVNATNAITIDSLSSGGVTFSNDVTTSAFTLNTNSSAGVSFTRKLTASTIDLTHNSTGTVNFLDPSALAITASSVFNFTTTRSGATTFNGGINTPTFNLTTLGTGAVTFNSTGIVNAANAFNIDARAANTITFNGNVNTAALNATTLGGIVVNASSVIAAPVVNVTTKGTTASTIAGNVNASSSFTWTGLGNNTTTFSGNVVSPTVAITNTGTMNFNGQVSGFDTFSLTHKGTGAVSFGNTAGNRLSGNNNSTINLTNFTTGTITVGGPLGGGITGTNTALNIVSTGTTTAGGIVNLRANNAFTGATSITGGTVNLDFSTTGANGSKLADVASLTLSRAILNIVGATAGGHNEVVANTIIGSGFSRIARSAGTGTIQLNQLTRTVGGVLDLGTASIATTDRTNTNGIIGGWATLNGSDWAINSTNGADGAITAFTAYTTNVAANTWTTATQNVRAGAALTGTAGNGTINSLKLDTVAHTLNQTVGTTLTIGSGGILTTGNFNRTLGTAGANLTAGTVAAATAYNAGAAHADLFFHINQSTTNPITVNSTIINNSALTPTTVGLVKSQGGLLILTANNTYTGQTTIAGGQLQLGNNTTTGSISSASTVVNDGLLIFNRSNAVAFPNNISGIGAVTKNNTTVGATLNLSGVNTYYGDTNVTQGTIQAGSATGLSPNSNFVFPASGTSSLELNGLDAEIGGLQGGLATSTVALGGNTLTVGNKNLSQTYAGIITGTGSIVKKGNGTLTLSGNNTFTGTYTQDAGATTATGTLAITGATVNLGTLTLSNATNYTIGGPVSVNNGLLTITGAGVKTITGPVVVNNSATFNTTSTTAGAGVVFDSTVDINDVAVLTLANLGTFNGAVNVNDGGTLTLSSTSAAKLFNAGLTVAPSGIVTLSGPNTYGGSGLTLNNAGSLTLAQVNIFNGPLTIAGPVALTLSSTTTSNTFANVVNVTGGSLAVSHANSVFQGLVTMSSPTTLAITGTGGTTAFNAGVQVSNGAFTVAGATNITSGGLTINNLGSTTLTGAAVITGDLNISGVRSSTFTGGVTVNGNTSLSNTRTVVFGGNNTFNGDVLFDNPNPINFSGTTTITGGVTINRGSVTIPGTTPVTSITVNGGSLAIGPAVGSPAIPITINGSGSLLSLTESATASGTFNVPFGSLLLVAEGKEFAFSTDVDQTLEGLIGGGGGLVKSGAGTLTIASPMSFQGDLNVTNGAVAVIPSSSFPGISSILPDRSTINLAVGTTLSLNGFREKVGAVLGEGAVDLGADGGLTLGGNNASGTLSGGISGTGFNTLVKQGNGTLTLTGAGSFNGKVTIEGGTLVAANAAGSAIGDTTNVAVSRPGATFSVTSNETVGAVTGVFGSSVNIGAGATLTTSYTDSSVGAIQGTLIGGSRIVSGLVDPGTRDLISSMFISNSNFVYDPSWVVQVIGTGQDGSPGLVLSASVLQPGGTGTLNFTRVGLLASSLTGAGDFVKNGTGALMLVGNNTNTGKTIINNGSIQLGGIEVSGRYVHQNILSDQSQLTFGTTGDQTVNLADNASNLLSYERVGSISGGSLLGFSTINLINGATATEKSIGALIVGGDNTSTTFRGQINGTDILAADQPGRGFFMKEGTGTFSFISTGGGFDGTTRVQAGTLAFPSGAGLKGDRGNVVISNEATAVLDSIVQQSVLSLAGGPGTTTTFRTGVVGALAGNRLGETGGEIKLSSAGISFVVNSNNGEHTFSGRITGLGGFAKADVHTAYLMGANTYTGDTQINGGALHLGYLSKSAGVGDLRLTDYVGSLSNSTLVTMTSGSLVLNNLNVEVRSLTSTAQLARVVLGNGTLTLNDADDEDFAGTIRSNGLGVGTGQGLPNVGVVEVKGGNFNLLSRTTNDPLTNDLTNLISIDGPRLVIGSGGNVGLGATSAAGGGNLADTTRVTVETGGTLSFLGDNITGEVIGSLQGNGTVALGNSGRTLVLSQAGGASHGTFTGVIAGTGNLKIDGLGSLILSGTNIFTGTTQLSSGASLSLLTGNTAGISTILPDTTVLRLGQGLIRLRGVNAETVGSTTLDAGMNRVVRDFGSTAQINLGAITVNSGGALQVSPESATTTNLNTNGILGGYALAGAKSWAINNGSGVITALDEGDYSTLWGANNHTTVDDIDGDGNLTVTNATTSTLRFGASVTAFNTNINLQVNQTATIAQGGIMMSREFGVFDAVISPGINTPKLVSGTDHLYIHQFNEQGKLTIGVRIQDGTNPLHVVKTGPGKVVLTGDNLFTGSLTIAGGTLQAGDGGFNGGALLGSTSSAITNNGILTFNTGAGSPEVTVFTPITGSGAVRQIGGGNSELTVASTYTGRTSVLAGRLNATHPLALGSAQGLTVVGDQGTLVISGDGGFTTTPERIALKGGTLVLTSGAKLGGQIVVIADSSISSQGAGLSAVSLEGSVISPQGQRILLNAPGNNGDILIHETNYWGGMELGAGSIKLLSGDLGRGEIIHNGDDISIETTDVFRVLANDISGTGGITQLANDLYLTGNNTFEGGINVSLDGATRAVLHIGSDTFTGSAGTGPIVVSSPTNTNSQIRFHRANTLVASNTITLNPNDNTGPGQSGGTAARNADLVKEGAGNLYLTGEIKAGPHGGVNDDPTTQRALITVNSGRLIFDGTIFTNSADSSLAINNNTHVEFLGDDANAQSGTLFGALGGGATWVLNSGVIKLNNTGSTGSGWNGNVFIRKGALETLAVDQLGDDLDLIINNGAGLSVAQADTVGNVFVQKGGVFGTNINVRLDDGDEKIISGFVTGFGGITVQSGTVNLYGTDNDFQGDLRIVGATTRVMSLGNVGDASAAGSGGTLIFGETGSTSNGTLEYIGAGNSSDRAIQLSADDAGSTVVNATLSSNGRGALNLSGDVTATAGLKSLSLSGSNPLANIFSGNLPNNVELIKTGTGTWRLEGSRAAYTGVVTVANGILEINSISRLGNMGGGTTRTFGINGGAFKFTNPSAVTETFNSLKSFLIRGTGGFTNDGSSTIVIDGTIRQPMGTGESTGSRSLVLDGFNSTNNTINGQITGTVSGQSTNIGIVKNGSGKWIINNSANNLTGATTINAGTLEINGGNALADGGTVTLSNAAVNGLAYGGSRLNVLDNETVGALAGAIGSIVDIASTKTLSLVAGSGTFQGVIQGGGGLTVSSNTNNSARIATLSNINTFGGVVSILGGTASDRSAANRIDVYQLANGLADSGIGNSSNAASNLVINTNGKGGGLRYIGFESVSTDRLFTLGIGNGSTVGESAASIWADGQITGNKVPTLSFTNTGALAFTGSGNRKLTLRGGNRGDGVSFNTFSPAIANGPGGTTSLGKTDDSIWLVDGSNSFTGAVNIERGTLIAGSNTALGTSAGGVVVTQSNNDTRSFLDIRNGVTITGESLTLTGGANNTGNGWGASSGVNVWTGTVANNGGNGIWSVLGETTSLRVSGAVSGGNTINKIGNGTLELAGSNTFSGQFNAMGGTVVLDYLTNNNSKLADGAALTVGGTGATATQVGIARGGAGAVFQAGSTIELRGGSHTETVSSTTLNAGAAYLTRPSGTSRLHFGGITHNIGATLDVAGAGMALTNTLNNTTVLGIVGGWLTVGKTDWGATGTFGVDQPVTATTSYVQTTTANVSWNNAGNQNAVLDVLSDIMGTGNVGAVRFNQAAARTVTMQNTAIIKTGGILVTPNVGANTITLTASPMISFAVPGCTTTAGSGTINCTSTAGLLPGMVITGTGIPAGRTVSAIATNTQFTINSGTSVTAQSNQTFTASVLTSLTNVATTASSTTVTCATTAGLLVNSMISCPNIPEGAIVTSITNATTFVVSLAATAAASGQIASVSGGITADSQGSSTRSLLIHQHNTQAPLVINAPLTNNTTNAVGLTKSGAGELIMTGLNSQTGGVFVNEGTLRVGQNGTPNASPGGTAAVQVNGTLIISTSGAERVLASGGAFRGNGTVTFDEFNTRTWVVSGNNSGFGGTLNVFGGKLALAQNPGDTDNNGLGSSRSIITVGPLGTIELRGSTTTTEENGVNQDITLYGTVRAEYLSTATNTSTARLQGAITIPNVIAPGVGGTVGAATDAKFDVSGVNSLLLLNNVINTNTGFTKIGNGRLQLNAQQAESTLVGDTGRSAGYTLLGQIKVNQGELWLSTAGNRVAGAPGVGNEIIVASGATLDLRDADLNYADDSSALRKIIEITGAGMNNMGALRNSTGTATFSHLVLNGDATVGVGSLLTGGRLDLNVYDTETDTGSGVGSLVDFQAPTLISSGGNHVLTKVGSGDFVLHDAVITGFERFDVKEGELRIEMNTPPNAGNMGGALTTAAVQQINIAYSGPGLVDMLNPSSGVGPIVGARLEFYRNVDLHHTVPIFMDGATAQANKGTNYIDLASDTVPGPRTYLDGTITVSGSEAKRNVFNIDGGVSNSTTIAEQGNQTVNVQAKMIIGGQIVGSGGISKIGFRELRLTNNNTYTGDTIIARSGNQALPSRSDTVTINGMAYTTFGEAESWGEWGVTLNGNGRLSGTGNIILQRTGMLTLDNSSRLDASSATSGANLADRVNDNANILMSQGWLRMIGSTTGDTSEALATGPGKSVQSLAGANIIDLWPSENSSQDLLLTIGKIQLSPGSVLRFRNLNSDSNFTASATSGDGEEDVRVQLSDASGLTQVGSGASTTSRAIVHGLLGGSSPNNVYEDTRITSDLYNQDRNRQNATGSGFMTLDNGYLRPLDDSEYATTTTGMVDSALADQNVNLTDFNHYMLGSVSVNSLRFGPTTDHDDTGAAVGDSTRLTSYTSNWQPTLILDDSAVLTVASGMLSSATFSHFGTGINNSTVTRGGTLNFGAREGIINNQNFSIRLTDGTYQSNNFEIQSVIAGSGGITKVGNPSVVFDAKNTYTGRTTINEGVLFARNGRNALGANGRAVGNAPHTGNDILITGGGDFRMINGGQIGAAGAFKDLTIGIMNGDNQALRSDSGNNHFFGNIMLDNVDAVGQTGHVGRPRISVNTNQTLAIYGDIYAASAEVTQDITIAEPRTLSLNGAGYISIRGQVGDRLVGSASAPVESRLTGRQTSATETNENAALRLQITANDDLNVSFSNQYNAAGRLSMDRGIMLIDYDPSSLAVGEIGFWTQAALDKMGASATSITSNGNAANGNSGNVGFLLGNNIGDGGGSAAVFLTKPGQVFNMPEWRFSNNHGGAAWIGGTNDHGTVSFGQVAGANVNSSANLSLDKTARFYAMVGGTVNINHRLNGGSFIKVGRGTVVLQNTVSTSGSDTHSFEVGGGTLVLNMNGQTAARVGNQGNFTGSGGNLIIQGMNDAGAVDTSVNVSTDANADRIVRFTSGLTQIIAEARGAKNVTFTLGNSRSTGTALLQRTIGATASFVAYNSAGSTGAAVINLNFNDGNLVVNAHKNAVIPWGVVGSLPNQASDFLMVDGTSSNRARTFNRALDEYKNDVTTWDMGEDLSEGGVDAAGAVFYGQLASGATISTLRFNTPSDSTLNIGQGQSLFLANSGLLVTTNSGAANKTITGGRLTTSFISTGGLTQSSDTITDLSDTSTLYVGMPVSGQNIPVGTFVQEIISPTSVRLTRAASGTNASQGVQFGTAELVVHHYGQGDLTINSGLGEGPNRLRNPSITNGSTTLVLSTTVGIEVGTTIGGEGILSGTTVAAVVNATTVTMSLPAYSTLADVDLLLFPKGTAPASIAGAATTSGSKIVTVGDLSADYAEWVKPGMVVTGPGIDPGTLIASVDNATQITLTNNANATTSGQTLFIVRPNDPVSTAVAFSGGSTTNGSATASVSSVSGMKPGMGIAGSGIPNGSQVKSVSTDGSNTFTLSQNASSTLSGQTYQGVFGALALTGGSINGTTLVTVASTAGIQTGMLVMMPGVPNGATVTLVNNSTQFTISQTATTTASGLVGYAQLPFAMPALLTNGATFTTPGNTDKVSVASTAGLVAGLTLAGPNLKSGTTIKTVVNSTDLQISTETLADGSGLTFVVGQPSYLPLTMVGGITTAGSNIITVASTEGVAEGLALNGPNIPASSIVASVDSSTQITMSANATADGLGLSITVLSPMSLTVSGPATTSPGEFGSTGAVVLTNERNFYGGRTVVNGGILSVSSIDALGPNPATEVANQLTLNGGTFRWTGTNGQFTQTRGLTLQGSGGTFDVVDPQANLMIQRGIVSQELYRGDLIKIGQGTLTFEGEAGGNQSSFQGLLDVREGTLRVAGDNPSGSAGDTTIFGSNFTWADGTVLRSGARLMLQMGNANGGGDWNFLDFLTTEGNNLITVGTLGAAVRPMNWNAPIAINGTTTFDVVPGQTFRLNNGGGFIQGDGDIIKDGLGQMEFRENIPDWKGGLTILQGRVLAANQADVLGTGHTVGKSITLGSTEHQSTADLLIHPDIGVAGAVYEVNMPINVVFNPAQTKRIGGLSQQGQGGQDLAFNGDITLNDNLILYYEEGNNGVPVGGEFVHINYNGSFKDGLTTSGNLVAQTREGGPNANDSQNGRFYVYHKLNNNNSAWTGDLVISDNTAYNQDQNTIVRIGHNLALTEKNDVTMYYNSILQAGGFSATIGSLSTKGGDGQFLGNAGTQSASANASTEIIENGAAVAGTIRINQSTPATAEVAWDAMFRDGTLASHWVVPGQSAAAASLNLVKGGDGWATLTLDNDYSGTTTVAAGILQVGRNGLGDTGALRMQNQPGTTVLQAGTLAGTGTVHGASLINGALKPGDVGGEAMGTINFAGDVVFGSTSVTTLQIQRASFNVPELLSADTGEFYNAQRNALLVDQSSTYFGELDTPVTTDQHDRVTIGGTVQAQAGARFRLLLNGYSPVAGDVFKLLDFASALNAAGDPGALAVSVGSQFRFGGEGGTDLDLPYLGDSFQWDTGLFQEYGILSVVDLRGEGEPPEGIILTSTPGNTLVPFGQSATFSIGAVGYPLPITYTMKRNNVLLPTGGAQTYTTPVITSANAASIVGKYVGTATNSLTSKSSDSGLAVNQAILAAVDTTTTKSIYIAPNGTTTFSVVTAAPTGVVLQYQWRKDGVAVVNGTKYAGATTNKLTLKAFTATEAGVYTCLVTLPASGGGAARFLESGTNTALLAALPDLLAPAFPRAAVGTPYNSPAAGYQFPFNPDPAKAPTKWVATGLPLGLTINATTGVISGSPTTATTTTLKYNKIYITATGVAGSKKVGPYNIDVDPIHAEAVGTFVGLVERSGALGIGSTGTNGNGTRSLGARLDVTTTKTASWTGKLTIGTTAYTLKGTLNTASASPRGTHTIVRKNGQPTLTLTFDIDTTGTRLLSGTLTDSFPTTANISGWRLIWGTKSPLLAATARLGAHNIMATIPASLEGDTAHPDIPQGDSYLTATVATTGSVTVKGKAADGTVLATTAPMGPTGQFLVYQTMYATTAQGSMIGTPQIDDTPAVHAVTGTLTWSRPAQASTIKIYQAGWALPITLDVTGGLYVKPVTGAIVMGARTPPASVLYNGTINSTITFFSSTGIPSTASVVNPNLDAGNTLGELNGLRINSPGTVIKPTAANAAPLTTTNPASVILTVTSTTGAITGSFKLKDGTVLRTVTYYGLIVPDVSTPNPVDGVGVGYYILTGAPTANPSKSGRVTLLPIFP